MHVNDADGQPGTGDAGASGDDETTGRANAGIGAGSAGADEPAMVQGWVRERRARPSRVVPVILAAAGASVILLVLAVTLLPRFGGDEGLVFVIPAGARAEVAVPTIDSAIAIPTKILFRAGEAAVITIHNEDTVPHRAGPFVVGAGQTLVQRFPNPGEYPIACSVDPLESIVVTVEGAL